MDSVYQPATELPFIVYRNWNTLINEDTVKLEEKSIKRVETNDLIAYYIKLDTTAIKINVIVLIVLRLYERLLQKSPEMHKANRITNTKRHKAQNLAYSTDNHCKVL